MQMQGEQHISAPRQKVWEALNDPEILKAAIPGCQSMDRDGEDSFAVIAEVKIGPIGARFKGNVRLSDIDAPNGYTIAGTGSGGIAGNAKGAAKVSLSDTADGGTLITYGVDAEVGGRMAQLGGPIIDATAKNLAGKFFAKFGEIVSGEAASAAAAATGPVPAETALTASSAAPVMAAGGQPAPAQAFWGWVAAVIAAILAGFAMGSSGVDGGVLALVSVALVLVAAASYEAGRRKGRP